MESGRKRPPVIQGEPSENDIRTAAYFLWEARGRLHGHDQADWFAARALLLGTPPLPPPTFRDVNAAAIREALQLSHSGHAELFSDSSSWIEVAAHPQTIFECDRNRQLHFDEGFLSTCRRILKDTSITQIAQGHHFPYRDLGKFRDATWQVLAAYERGAALPPPLFFYPAPYQLEILDGVHRCLAAYELTQTGANGRFSFHNYRIWLGFDRTRMSPGAVTHQVWTTSVVHSMEAAHVSGSGIPVVAMLRDHPVS